MNLLREFCRFDYLVIAANYRLKPQRPTVSKASKALVDLLANDHGLDARIRSSAVSVAASVEDIGALFSWVDQQSGHLAIDVDDVTLIGASAGAISSLLAAYSSVSPVRQIVRPGRLVSLWGGLFGLERTVEPGAVVPTLLVHGTDDDVIPLAESLRLAELLGKQRGSSLVIMPGMGHGLDRDREFNQILTRDGASLPEEISDWIRKTTPLHK